MDEKTSLSQSTTSQSSSSAKCRSTPASSSQTENDPPEKTESRSCKSYLKLMVGSDSVDSLELEDSLDAALQLLLDFPVNNDMTFLEGSPDPYGMSPYYCREI